MNNGEIEFKMNEFVEIWTYNFTVTIDFYRDKNSLLQYS